MQAVNAVRLKSASYWFVGSSPTSRTFSNSLVVECLFSTQTTRVQFPIGEKASLAQLVERCSCKAKAGSSTLPGGFARLAQWIERQTSNLEVAGSIPASGFSFLF